jgi:hypothetical protein
MEGRRPTHRDKAAMNGAQISLFAQLKRVAGSVSGPPAGVNPLYAVGVPRSMQASLKIEF